MITRFRFVVVTLLVSAAFSMTTGRAADAAAKTNAPAAAVTNEVSVFPDKALESAVRRQVFAKRDTDKPITAADVANISTIQGARQGITNLAGIEHCKALASLELPGNRISDLTPLTGLRQLQFVNIQSNRISDITALGTLPALQYIDLSGNQVDDPEPLAACTNLASIYLSNNRIYTIETLTRLPRVVSLYLDGNKLRTIIGLDNLRGLSTVSISRNEVKDITPLTKLRAPTFFLLENNRIKDISPLLEACKADAAGPKNYAPFLNLYLKGNPLEPRSVEMLEELKKIGTRVHFK